METCPKCPKVPLETREMVRKGTYFGHWEVFFGELVFDLDQVRSIRMGRNRSVRQRPKQTQRARGRRQRGRDESTGEGMPTVTFEEGGHAAGDLLPPQAPRPAFQQRRFLTQP